MINNIMLNHIMFNNILLKFQSNVLVQSVYGNGIRLYVKAHKILSDTFEI